MLSRKRRSSQGQQKDGIGKASKTESEFRVGPSDCHDGGTLQNCMCTKVTAWRKLDEIHYIGCKCMYQSGFLRFSETAHGTVLENHTPAMGILPQWETQKNARGLDFSGISWRRS